MTEAQESASVIKTKLKKERLGDIYEFSTRSSRTNKQRGKVL